MQRNQMIKKLSKVITILSLIILVGCSGTDSVDVVPTFPQVTLPSEPIQPKLNNVSIMVLTKDNLSTILDQIKKDPSSTYIIMTPDGYTLLANNLAELDRYIKQQNAIILYYKDTISTLTQSKNQ